MLQYNKKLFVYVRSENFAELKVGNSVLGIIIESCANIELFTLKFEL